VCLRATPRSDVAEGRAAADRGVPRGASARRGVWDDPQVLPGPHLRSKPLLGRIKEVSYLVSSRLAQPLTVACARPRRSLFLVTPVGGGEARVYAAGNNDVGQLGLGHARSSGRFRTPVEVERLRGRGVRKVHRNTALRRGAASPACRRQPQPPQRSTLSAGLCDLGLFAGAARLWRGFGVGLGPQRTDGAGRG